MQKCSWFVVVVVVVFDQRKNAAVKKRPGIRYFSVLSGLLSYE